MIQFLLDFISHFLAVMLDHDAKEKNKDYIKLEGDHQVIYTRKEKTHLAIYKQNEFINTATCQEVFDGNAYHISWSNPNVTYTFTDCGITNFKDIEKFERFEWLMLDPQIAEHYQRSLWVTKETADIDAIEGLDQLPY
jgi:hypothetical protein